MNSVKWAARSKEHLSLLWQLVDWVSNLTKQLFQVIIVVLIFFQISDVFVIYIAECKSAH